MQVVITIDKYNKIALSQSGHLTSQQLTDVLCTAQLLVMNTVIAQATKDNISPENLEKLKQFLWEQYNISASNLLDEFLPNNMRKDLTVEAILRAENEILEEQPTLTPISPTINEEL